MKDSLVVLSGGQDSTTVLGVAMSESHVRMALTFNYGQRHLIEVNQANKIAREYDIEHKVVNLSDIFRGFDSALLNDEDDISAKHGLYEELPASFVPARNALFLTVAFGIAITREYELIYAGMCQTDYSGYPDCRDNFIKLLNKSLIEGYERNIEIRTPLMFLTKAQTFELAHEMHVLDTVLDYSVTCYEGDMREKHEWGYGCGVCPACKLRIKGWDEWKAMRRIHAEDSMA